MPDDSDHESDQESEFALWKEREMKRLRAELDEKLEREWNLKEIEAWWNMTEKQREEDNLKSRQTHTEKWKYNFLQKHYKVGAYGMDKAEEDPKYAILKWDYNAPVGEDKFDKSQLPQILQKRRGDTFRKG